MQYILTEQEYKEIASAKILTTLNLVSFKADISSDIGDNVLLTVKSDMPEIIASYIRNKQHVMVVLSKETLESMLKALNKHSNHGN